MSLHLILMLMPLVNWGEPHISDTTDFRFYNQRSRAVAISMIDMVKNYCLYKWYGRCSAKKGQKLSQPTPN